MSETIEIPFREDVTIQAYTDWNTFGLLFADGSDQAIDFTGKTFVGEVLTEYNGDKLEDLSFNTPSSDGIINPRLTNAQTDSLDGEEKAWYFVRVVDGADIQPYFSGQISVDLSFKLGA